MSENLIGIANDAMPYVMTALGAYGAAVLTQVQEEAAVGTVSLGRRLAQKIFGTRQEGEEVPEELTDAIEDPQDPDNRGALRKAIRKALANDAALAAEVSKLVAQIRALEKMAEPGQHVTWHGDHSVNVVGGPGGTLNTTVNEAPKAEDPFKRGQEHLKHKHYTTAATSLEDATRNAENSAESHFLLAIATLGDKRIRLQKRSVIERAERELAQALAQRSQHEGALLLSAIIKEDYYEANSKTNYPPPPPDQLLDKARETLTEDSEHISAILSHIVATESSVWRYLKLLRQN
ncbi:hypothetical protein [Streptomyces sp. S.PB5]|uniref:hypothetical protein n=1 Tax=Streptomyces sp. S.PB5 TaxID=3020844 RepID=UPI0025B21641|nr:hypothetical protein [Streptomyces sp. S.PB5]MDN3020601.1 hypothetical protein [Streptomyces sp. S.PB5]